MSKFAEICEHFLFIFSQKDGPHCSKKLSSFYVISLFSKQKSSSRMLIIHKHSASINLDSNFTYEILILTKLRIKYYCIF